MCRLEEIVVDHCRIANETSILIKQRLFSKSEEEGHNFTKLIESNIKKLDELRKEIPFLIKT
ncbi:hypothetical protein JHL18_13105 [Clostridium sp. YIM B02505]|uniref:Uncharacterized protein n=1 Tax=Clostridium yunnanense TaxID=2800325 RepID=A0ABS1EQ99_9CLOT|nr:hypothetical protein [Clostridium yunnanense]MBK1811560.1 hypothetical protein [Clostridium yunnanense]